MTDEGYLLLKEVANMQKRAYTAAEMLNNLADWFDAGCKTEIMDKAETAAMLRQAAEAMDDAAIKRGAKALHKIAYGNDVPWTALEPADRAEFKREAALVLAAATTKEGE